jgi:hypothetical protein
MEFLLYVGMFMVNLYTKFHIPNSSDSPVITTKPKAKENFHIGIMLFSFYKKNYL